MNERRENSRSYHEGSIGLEIDSTYYPVHSLSSTGFSMYAKDSKLFKVGDVLQPIRLVFIRGGETVIGQVVHVTQAEELWTVGVKFVFPEDDNEYFRRQYEDLDKDHDINKAIRDILEDEDEEWS